MKTKNRLSTGRAPAQSYSSLNAKVIVALRKRYSEPQYAFLEQVRSATGFARNLRTADALAMGLWKTRTAHELIGFEIKISRADWLHERRRPEKADEIARYCNRWFLVTGTADVVRDLDELPTLWGLLVLDNAAGKIVQKKAAGLLPEPAALDRVFLAAILRRVVREDATTAEIQAAVADARLEVRRELEANYKRDLEYHVQPLRDRVNQLQSDISAFERASGVQIARWQGERIGKAVGVVLADSAGHYRSQLKQLERTADALARGIRDQLSALEQELNGNAHPPA